MDIGEHIAQHHILALNSGANQPPSFTWATKPAATAVATRARIHISDVGPESGQGSEWESDGTNWRPVGGHVIIGGSAAEVSVSNINPNTTLNLHKTFTLPSGIILPGCYAEVYAKWSHTASANNKYMRLYLGGTAGTLMANYNDVNASSVLTDAMWAVDFITSSNGAGTQLGKATGTTGSGVSGSAHYTGSVNTTAATSLDLVSNMASTTETMTLKSSLVTLIYR